VLVREDVRTIGAPTQRDDRIVLEAQQRVADVALDTLLDELFLERVRVGVADAAEPLEADLSRRGGQTTSGNSAPPR
jgi:hypothetical protein